MTSLAWAIVGVWAAVAWSGLYVLGRAVKALRARDASLSAALGQNAALHIEIEQFHMSAERDEREWLRLYSIATLTIDEQRAEINRLRARSPYGWTIHDTPGSYR